MLPTRVSDLNISPTHNNPVLARRFYVKVCKDPTIRRDLAQSFNL